MHRFRKKSDASTRRGPIGIGGPSAGLGIGIDLPDHPIPLRSSPVIYEPLPELPPASNFRTSLILPDLTRRFTLLRTSSGEPLSIEQLRNRFAEQRARGAENQISEEEEDMILETLGQIRGGGASQNGHGNGNGNAHEGEDGNESLTSREGGNDSDYLASFERSSIHSSHTITSSIAPSVRSSPNSRSSGKRYSNNLFGSGRTRDYSARSQKSGGSQRSALSIAPTESSMSLKGNSMYSEHSARPTTPDGDSSVQSISAQSSPVAPSDDKTPQARSAPLNPPGPYVEQSYPAPSALEYRLFKTLPPASIKRASLALEEALKEIEEEIEEEAEEDEVVMPRSAPAARSHYSMQNEQSRFSANSIEDSSRGSGMYEAGTAISSDKHTSDPELQRTSTSPVPYNDRRGTMSPRIPGYIPGMPRPMTPHDPLFDSSSSDDQSRPHSTTPRPISPLLPSFNGRSSPLIPASIAASFMRRESTQSTGGYSPRSQNGGFAFDETRGSADLSLEDALNPSFVGGRRRPASPLASPATFQPMAVSSPSSRPPSRPTTPSNVTWNTSSSSFSSNSHGRSESGGRSRSGSLTADESPSSIGMLGRSLRSPVQSESPGMDRPVPPRSHSPFAGRSMHNPELSVSTQKPSGAFELASPPAATHRALHAPTPTQNRSPVSPSIINELASTAVHTSRRSSRQTAPSSPFNLGSANPLVFSPRPRANSSSSSIESEGSSYHSDEGSRKRDRDLDLFSDLDTSYSAWHDLSSTEKTSSATNGEEDEWDAEEVISRYAGLTKFDFAAIQEKLVGAAIAKASTPDPRERAPSLRRRRPSTSQSNYSLNGRDRVASPAPQIQAQVEAQVQAQAQAQQAQVQAQQAQMQAQMQLQNGHSTTEDGNSQIAQASTALGSSVSRNLASADQPSQGRTREEQRSDSPKVRDLSPTSRRRRDLDAALFGEQTVKVASPETSPDKPAYNQPAPSTPALVERSPSHVRSATEEPGSAATAASPVQIVRNASILRSPQALVNQTELAREVQRKTEAATASLKRGASAKYHTTNASSTSISFPRKRIAPHQISSPHLVSASTSMDTIPLRSPSVTSGNLQSQQPRGAKLGQRLRKWGTLRGKPNTPNGDEITPFPLDAQSPTTPHAQTIRYDSSNTNLLEPPATAGLMDSGRPKIPIPIPSPPATAGPGLKSFMSRFRKNRPADVSPERDRRSIEQERRQPPQVSPGASSGHSTSPLNEYVFPRQSHSAPATKATFQSSASPHAPQPSASLDDRNVAPEAVTPQQQQSKQLPDTPAQESLALKQLFDAASNLGLDQTALNDLLARSNSSSRSTTTMNLFRNELAVGDSSRPPTRTDSALDRARSPSSNGGRPNEDVYVERKEDRISTLVPRRRIKSKLLPDGQEGDAAANPVVRRTIIFPSDSRASTIDVNILMRKNSQSRKRQSASAASVTSSSRSVHDRAPTPPPPRSPTGRRFSHDASPPVPQLPVSFSAQAENLLPLPTPRANTASPMEKSSSAYDSLYEMYAGGLSDNEGSPTSPHGSQANTELGRGVEVIELANGETIWSIVNGLRDEDAESLYASRSSIASDFSASQSNAEGVQVLFKEHARAGSKGSNSSFLSRKKSLGKSRPETKVFYSSSNQIGRLIENLSEGQESGSFNFLPNRPQGHASSPSFGSESDMHWTVEERLEHMLGSIGNS